MSAEPRRANVWHTPVVPRWRDMFGDAAQRKLFFAYWKHDGPLDLLDHILFPVFGLMPPSFASRIGGLIARRIVMPKYPQLVQRARDNLKRIRPDLADATREKMILSHFDNKGRLFAEFPVITALNAAGRIMSNGDEKLTALHAQGRGVVLVGLHIANWEIMGAVWKRIGLPGADIYLPPRRAAQLHFALKVRKTFGATLLPPGKAGTRPGLRFLKAGGVLAIFCDEEREGKCMAPFFGRPAHINGNLAVAVRLSRLSGAPILFFYSERLRDGNYCITFKGPVSLPSQNDSGIPLLDDVTALNAAIEPVVRANCSNWYFLDRTF